jgi:predicted metalloprotease with PDZ domain
LLRLFPPLLAAWVREGEQAAVDISGRNAERVLFGTIGPLAGPVNLRIEAPANWHSQTGMESGPEPNTFRAPNYDTFADASVVLGPDLDQTEFEYKGVPHYVVFIGKGNYDERRITDDTRKVVSTLIDMMNGAPYRKYVFFLRARQGPGAGGLELLNLLCAAA